MAYSFTAKVWKYEGKAGWYFVNLPKLVSAKIRAAHGGEEEGWGRLKAKAEIGSSLWQTAIWFDTKARGYLLPIKSTIRAKEKIRVGARVSVRLYFESNSESERISKLVGGV